MISTNKVFKNVFLYNQLSIKSVQRDFGAVLSFPTLHKENLWPILYISLKEITWNNVFKLLSLWEGG